MVTAGLANDVDEVAQYAAPTHPATAAGASAARPDRASANTTRTRPAVATTPPSHGGGAARTAPPPGPGGRANIGFASPAPPIPPASCAAAYTAASRPGSPA